MARVLSKYQLLGGSVAHHPRHRSSFLRHFSSKPELFEIDLESSSSSSPASVINKMEEIIQSIIVQKSTPIWLPFLPGSSFWVPLPAHGSKRVSNFIEKLTNQLSDEESLSLTTGRGWPSSSFFIPDGDSADVAGVDVEVKFSEPEEGEVQVELLIDSGKKPS